MSGPAAVSGPCQTGRAAGRGRRGRAAAILAAVVLLAACQPTVRLQTPPLPEVPLEAQPIVPVVPSAEAGRVVFERNCAFCHGTAGRGDGPAARGLRAPRKNPFTDTMRLLGIRVRGEDLPSRPANFTNLVQMRLNSPAAMYETVSRGRPHTAMPAFGPDPAYGANDGLPDRRDGTKRFLPDADRWHVVFYEWTFATSPQQIARGQALYQARPFDLEVAGAGRGPVTCAGCHGPNGDGRGGRLSGLMARTRWGWALGRGPGIFTDRDFMVKRKPTELFAGITDRHPFVRIPGQPQVPAYKRLLREDELWALVDYLWTFVYRSAPPAAGAP